MNITHYCSKCDRFHPDISCTEFQRRYPALDSIDVQMPCDCCGADGLDYLCCCPSEEHNSYKHNREVARVIAAIRETEPKLLDAHFSDFDAEYARRAWGVQL